MWVDKEEDWWLPRPAGSCREGTGGLSGRGRLQSSSGCLRNKPPYVGKEGCRTVGFLTALSKSVVSSFNALRSTPRSFVSYLELQVSSPQLPRKRRNAKASLTARFLRDLLRSKSTETSSGKGAVTVSGGQLKIQILWLPAREFNTHSSLHFNFEKLTNPQKFQPFLAFMM